MTQLVTQAEIEPETEQQIDITEVEEDDIVRVAYKSAYAKPETKEASTIEGVVTRVSPSCRSFTLDSFSERADGEPKIYRVTYSSVRALTATCDRRISASFSPCPEIIRIESESEGGER